MNQLTAAMTETDLQALIIDTATQHNWLVYHTHDSRRSNSGFPDLVLVRRQRVMFVELKSERGRVRPDQQVWLDALEDVDTVRRGWCGRPMSTR